MSTHSNIGIKRDDGTVDSIYCHFDGYPSGVGDTLVKYHNNKEDAELIISLGDASCISEKIIPEGEHSFDKPENNCSIFYSRDRAEDLNISHYNSITRYINDSINDCGIEWIYLWNNNHWECYDGFSGDFCDLYDEGL